MKWDDVGEMPCSVARTAAVLGDRWTLLILRNAFLGIRRFDAFQAQLGVTRHVLADRLARLVDDGIFEKRPYQANPPRHEYRLTDKGRDLHPILLALTAWGDRWKDDGAGPPVLLRHKRCGKLMRPVMVCSECGEPLDPRDIEALPGPGWPAAAQGETH
ncbi:winged helix-turn-helix transcriptional regulator [Burkholderia sp. Ac-20379]|uniref:winged helix-turn-helix transcriptional regulator n=1 Tax=Burkholderia sp. Ac-20379 TaxID=2703900 RepID=UPI00197CF194|nr:helix-turn-helix domain-containing protein [Burkholderia sp. Ac-20379]MBN3723094.1 helix-turn-helix transcriptional regulator [Burkholderia sp. Ac-20379]